MEKITTVIDSKCAKELASKNRLNYITSFVAGLTCVGMYLGFSIANGNWGDTLNIIMLIAGILCLGISTFMVINIVKAIKEADVKKITSISDFQDEYVVMELYNNQNEKIDESKLYYNTLYSYYERKHYVFLKINQQAYMPVLKVPGLVDFLKSKGLPKK